MFVVSMKTTRPRVFVSLAVVALLFITMLTLSGRSAGTPAKAAASGADDTGRVAYLQGLGYEVEAKPVAVQEVIIPADTDGVFAAYNALQKAAGQDLTPYCGERVKCWTYTVTNYPGEESVQAHLYVHNDKIIGGDISATERGGFSHGLTPLTGESNGQTG